MRESLIILPVTLLVGVHATAQDQAVEPVLRSELAFARCADQEGIRTAFRTWLLAEAKVFTPRLTTAREQYDPEPGDPGHLAWYPEAMGIAASGDLAWSFGPWTYAAGKGERALVHGHFLSIWRHQAGLGWKVEADIGVPHAAPGVPSKPFAASGAAISTGRLVPKVPDAASMLRQKEAELSAAWSAQGGEALIPSLAKGARILRAGASPAVEAGGIQKLLGSDRPGSKWEPSHTGAARSGDLAWTCGESSPDDRGISASFLRVWILESDAWKVLFDVRLPHPAAKK
jgi:hypothetical protein